MILLRMCVLSAVVAISVQNQSILVNKDNLFRRKRYLAFAPGTNFGITFSAVSAILIVQPTGCNWLAECDFPFALPSDTRWFRGGRHRRAIEQNEIYSALEEGLSSADVSGRACVKRMICEAMKFSVQLGKSLVKDMLFAIFTSDQADFGIDYKNACDKINFQKCRLPLLDLIVASMTENF